MKNSPLVGLFQYLYVVFAGILGISIAVKLFAQDRNSAFWQVDPINSNLVLVKAPVFITFIFFVAFIFAFLAVIFLPLWKQLFDLLKEGIWVADFRLRVGKVILLCVGELGFLLMLSVFFQIAGSIRILPHNITSDLRDLLSQMRVLIACILVVVMPVPMISLIVYDMAYEIMKRLPMHADDEKALLSMAMTLLRYRKYLQNNLLLIGIVTSMVPILTAVVRALAIQVDTTGTVKDMWLDLYPIMYGLAFTTILIVFYAPSHLALNQAGSQLRDAICPISDTEELEVKMKKRKELDDWLQTNLDLFQNLKAGMATLAPLITGFLTSIPGLKIFSL